MAATESKKQIGVRGEDLACAELERQRMQVLERNWRCRARRNRHRRCGGWSDSLTLIFCEVKCRSGLGFGIPLRRLHARRCVRVGGADRLPYEIIGLLVRVPRGLCRPYPDQGTRGTVLGCGMRRRRCRSGFRRKAIKSGRSSSPVTSSLTPVQGG
jgi:hypothetical protein